MADFKLTELQKLIKHKYGTQEAFAIELGFNPKAFSRKIRRKAISIEEATMWCDMLDIPEEMFGYYFYCKKV